jgi:hypothetical protein
MKSTDIKAFLIELAEGSVRDEIMEFHSCELRLISTFYRSLPPRVILSPTVVTLLPDDCPSLSS